MAIKTAFNRIKREVGVKRCIILDGNTDDIYIDDKGGLKNLEGCLESILVDKEYHIITWDSISGLKGDTSHLRITNMPQPQGDEYDLDDEDSNEQTTSRPNQEQIVAKTPKDIFNLVRLNISNPPSNYRYAFIINVADFIFGSATATDAAEREWLTLLFKSVKDREVSSRLRSDENVVIFITKSLGSLPVSLYQKNPDVSCITISKPDRSERECLFKKISSQFDIKQESDSVKQAGYIDMLEDFTNREIMQMGMMSKNEPSMSYDKLFFLFKYGEKENPWEKLDYDAVKKIGETLARRVIGQNTAIAKVESVVKKAYMGLTGIHKSSSRNAPKGVLFFVGPTGVGKTELSKALAKFLFGDEQACIRFDMSEYAQEMSDQKLIGAPPGYVGYEEGGQLTNAVREKPFSIILFDEIEKAAKPNPRILDIFLQILEDGRLTDSKGETVYFSESVIIFTSNLGAADISPEGTDEEVAQRFIAEVKRYFNDELKRPELLGRIGYSNIVPFNFIRDRKFSERIAASKLEPVKQFIFERFGLRLEFADQQQFIKFVLGGVDTSKGGRDILNAINDRLLDDLAAFLFDNKEDLPSLKDSKLLVEIEDNELKPRFE